MVLFADTGSEKTDTYAFLPVFRRWMDRHDVASDVVRYKPRNFKHWPPYDSLGTNMLTNATLPSKAFGRGSCSLKWKVAPQDKWTAQWAPAIRCWGEGGRVVKLIGYDCSSADQRDRKSVVSGKSVSVRVDYGGGRNIKNKKKK